MKKFNTLIGIGKGMKSEFVIFVAVSAFLVGALYSSSTFIAFGAETNCSESAPNPSDLVCVTTDKGKFTKVQYCYVNKDGKEVCITVWQASTASDIPPDVRDAISKAQAQGVKPDISLGESQSGNNTKPPKDLGGFNSGLNNDENGPSVNPGSD